MHIRIRRERPSDHQAVEALTREAFWNVHVPGCDEHYLVRLLRDTPAFVKALDFVAEADGRLAGSILYSVAHIVGPAGTRHPVLTFGPLSVHPAYQKQGVGSALVRHSVAAAKAMDYPAILIYGDPEYYSRFGFVPAWDFRITPPDGLPHPALQVLPLRPDALHRIAGHFHEDPVYHIDPAAAEAFDAGFPPRQKGFSQSQRRFQALSAREDVSPGDGPGM